MRQDAASFNHLLYIVFFLILVNDKARDQLHSNTPNTLVLLLGCDVCTLLPLRIGKKGWKIVMQYPCHSWGMKLIPHNLFSLFHVIAHLSLPLCIHLLLSVSVALFLTDLCSVRNLSLSLYVSLCLAATGFLARTSAERGKIEGREERNDLFQRDIYGSTYYLGVAQFLSREFSPSLSPPFTSNGNIPITALRKASVFIISFKTQIPLFLMHIPIYLSVCLFVNITV